MRRILVPLDGSKRSETAIPDARQLAGPDGVLILVRDANWPQLDQDIAVDTTVLAVAEVERYLQHEAETLRDEGVNVETHALTMIDPAYAIGVATRFYHADIVACATHGRGPFGRLMHGSVAWRALADSPVPVLVRHSGALSARRSIFAPERRILVPLDGSRRAEKALPLAQELAGEWQAAIWLVHVISHYPITGLPKTDIAPEAATDAEARREALYYLEHIAAPLTAQVRIHVLFGDVAEEVSTAARTWDIGHIVMTSHGRTGLPRVVLGSVADELIQRLACPIIVIPVHAVVGTQDREHEAASVAAEPGPRTT